MLTDAELAQMKADAKRITKTKCIQHMALVWSRDIDRPRLGCDACDKFIVASVNLNAAANVLRLLEEVSTLRKAGDAITTHLSFVERQGVINNEAYYKMLYDRMLAAGFRIVDEKGGAT